MFQCFCRLMFLSEGCGETIIRFIFSGSLIAPSMEALADLTMATSLSVKIR